MAVKITNNPVNEEIDPGFGVDTEQRRVEFAAQLEQEAFDIAMNDALKLARTYLITVMKVQGYQSHVQLVNQLDLPEIILLWRLFDMLVIGTLFQTLSKDEADLFLDSQHFQPAMQGLFNADDDASIKSFRTIGISSGKTSKVRDIFGGVLVFSMRSKTFTDCSQVYKDVESKISGSMRSSMKRIFSAYKVDNATIRKVLTERTSHDIILELFKHVARHFGDEEVEVSDEMFLKVARMLNIFSKDAPQILNAAYKRKQDAASKEVEEKVKSFYGIT